MTDILDIQFNAAVRTMCAMTTRGGWCDYADDTAFNSLEKLTAFVEANGHIPVWSGACDNTIFGDATVNMEFRAWHDSVHYHNQFPFTPEGERETCEAQCAQLIARYGDSEQTQEWCDILRAEIVGQERFFQRWGAFPKDQIGFVRAYLGDAKGALQHIPFAFPDAPLVVCELQMPVPYGPHADGEAWEELWHPIQRETRSDSTDVHGELRKRLGETFGGFSTVEKVGWWRKPGTGRLAGEKVKSYSVAIPDVKRCREEFARIARFAGYLHGQEAVYYAIGVRAKIDFLDWEAE